jgi:hypothetical protein
MKPFRQTPDEDVAQDFSTKGFSQRDRWSGEPERPLPSLKLLATLFAFTSIGMLALVD